MRDGECSMRVNHDGLLLVSTVEVAGRVDNDTSLPSSDVGILREGGIERTVLYFDRETFDKLKEWYRA